jgi:eukaryotic-like serine/threonine-protein kinase
MAKLTHDRWQAVSTHLDRVLELPEDERAAWLSAFRKEQPELATDLEALVEEHRTLTRRGFLEQSPAAMPATGLTVAPSIAGQTFGAYTLVSPIGEGGMGTVWLARRSDGRYEREVAIKVPSVSLLGTGGGERFKREGSFLGRLAHPNIAALVDAGVTPAGQPYLVLEHVAGDQIDRWCSQHKLDIEARVRIFLDVLAAVGHAHANLIVHRDIKPSNVLVTTAGQVKLLDFGIAKLLEGDAADGSGTRLTRAGEGAMTPEFASPEQISGRQITTVTDVYGLGVLLYYLLTGEHPVGPGPHSTAELVKKIVEIDPPRPSDMAQAFKISAETIAVHATRRSTTPEKLRRTLRGDLDTIVAKTLKKDPRERYASVTALADDLRRWLEHKPIAARPDTLVYSASRFVRRNRVAVALAAVAFAATIAGVAGTLIQARTARQQRDLAVRQLKRTQTHDEFLEFLLSDAAPSGKPFTVNDLLARGEKIVRRQHAGDDASRLELMSWIGRDYLAQDDDASARRILSEAYAVSRKLSDPSARAIASCDLGAILTRDQELDRAELSIQEGLRELPDDLQFDSERIGCLRNGSEVAQSRGDTREGIARLQSARQLLRQSPYDSALQELHLTMDLANLYSLAGQDREAIAAYEQASATLTSLGRDETQTAVVLFNNWAIEMDQLGRPLEAEHLYRRAIDISRAGQTEDAVSPMVLNNYARSLRDLGRLDEAADYSERAYAKGKQTDHQLAVNQSLLERARIYRARREFARATAMLAEVEPRLSQSLPPGHYAFAALASERSLLALDEGDLATASRLADQAVAIVEAAIKAGEEGAFYLPTALVRRAQVRLAAGRPAESATDAVRAVGLLRESAPADAFSSGMGRACLALGRALEAQGRHQEARAAFGSAVKNLDGALGPENPETRAARQLAGTGAAEPAPTPAPAS